MYKKTVQLDVFQICIHYLFLFLIDSLINIIKRMINSIKFNTIMMNSCLSNKNGLTHNGH